MILEIGSPDVDAGFVLTIFIAQLQFLEINEKWSIVSTSVMCKRTFARKTGSRRVDIEFFEFRLFEVEMSSLFEYDWSIFFLFSKRIFKTHAYMSEFLMIFGKR